MEFVFIGVAFIVGMVGGAFSHKYLASEVQSMTGINAQTAANKVNAEVKKL